MNVRASFAVLLASCVAPSLVTGQTSDSAVRVTTDALELEIGGRLHTQFNTTSIDGLPSSELFIRRARIEFSATLGERVSAVLQPEFGGDQVSLRDAYVAFELTPELTFMAGNAYRPFGLLEQTSSKRILPIERGLRIRGLQALDEYAVVSGLDYSDRDIGVQLSGSFEDGIDFRAGVFRGPLHGSVGANSSYQYAARVTGAVTPDLRLGAGWSNRDFAAGAGAGLELQRGNAFEIDMEYGGFVPGLHVLAEIASGDVNPFTDDRFYGAQAWIAYRTEPIDETYVMLEPLLRVSYSDLGIDGVPATQRGGTLLTPGFAVYFGPLNRLALNYDIWWSEGTTVDANSFKVMFQVGF